VLQPSPYFRLDRSRTQPGLGLTLRELACLAQIDARGRPALYMSEFVAMPSPLLNPVGLLGVMCLCVKCRQGARARPGILGTCSPVQPATLSGHQLVQPL
jgi:hypothetical protein